MLNFISLDAKTNIIYTRYRLNIIDQNYNRILIPEGSEDLHKRIFHHSHETSVNAHFGVAATRLRASERFYFPGMSAYISRRIKECGKCLAKIRKPSEKDATHHPKRAGFIGERVSLDLVGPVNPESPDGHRFKLTAQDNFSGYSCAWPIKNKESYTVAHTFIENWVCTYGVPDSIYSDQGQEFMAKTWIEMCGLLQIDKKTTNPYSSWSNPTERFHRTLWQCLRIFMEKEDVEWTRYLQTACLAFNTKIKSDVFFAV